MKVLSIVVPVYNVETYLPICVDSILRQSFTDYELILVDDGSTDQSGTLCDEYAVIDERISVIHKNNGGLSSARNAGLDMAKGEFISFIDSDDFVEPNMFEQLIHIQSYHNADIVICGYTRDKEMINNDYSTFSQSVFSGIEYLKHLFCKSGRDFTNGISAWAKLYKSSLFNGIRYPEGYVFEDEGTTHKLYLKSKTVVQIDVPFYHYIKREDSIITSLKARQIHDKQYVYWIRFIDLSSTDFSLALKSAKMYYAVSYSALISAYKESDWISYRKSKKLLLESKREIRPFLDKYGKLYLWLLSFPLTEKWLLINDFEPIQKIIRKVKRIK